MIDIANDDRHGYCRYAGFPMGNGIVSTGRYFNPDVDCSSFVYYALKNTGYVSEIRFSQLAVWKLL